MKKKLISIVLFLMLCLTGCSREEFDQIQEIVEVFTPEDTSETTSDLSLEEIPEWDGSSPYVTLDLSWTEGFLEEDWDYGYEFYSDLDSLGRCGVVESLVGYETMPTEDRGNISSVKPSGWVNHEYEFVDGGYLYNRCHLIGYQLTGENANEENLITGTRYMNVEGMLPFENQIDDYIDETGNHVKYRVTPVFEEDHLVADGVLLEAYSIEDSGGLQFRVYCYNVQPGVTIDYETGENWEN